MLRIQSIVLMILTAGILTGCGGGDSGSGKKSLAERQAIAMNMTSPVARAKELLKIADAQFASGERNGAKSSLAGAQAAIDEIEENGARAQTGIAIATALAKHGMEYEAKEILKKVREAIEADTNPATKASSLGRMALVYGVSLENETAADVYLADATSLVDDIPEAIDRVNALLDIGAAYQQIDRAETAEAQFTTAAHSARAAETPRGQADLLVAVANRLQSLGLAEQAGPIREEARTVAGTIMEDFSRGYALLAVASSYKSAGESSTASTLFDEADKAADKVSDTGIQGELREAIRRAK